MAGGRGVGIQPDQFPDPQAAGIQQLHHGVAIAQFQKKRLQLGLWRTNL
jgi:hypothetical protein